MQPGKVTIKQMREFCLNNEKRPIRHIDINDTLICRAIHLVLYLKIMMQFDEVVFKDLNPLDFCYELDSENRFIRQQC